MWSFWILTVFVLSFYVERSFGDLPANIHKCKYEDYPCISQSMEAVVMNYAKTGLKEMNLIPFEPLHVKSLKLERNPRSPVSVEVAFKDIDVLGLTNAKVKRLKGFNKDPSVANEVELLTPKITLKGPYSVNGNVLVLPIVGQGNSEIVLENVIYLIKSKNKAYEKDGKKYLDFENIKLEIKPKHVRFNLEGLFNGNKELGDNMNKFINDNWKEIFTELEPAIAEAFALIMKHILSQVFSKYPYEQYFDNA